MVGILIALILARISQTGKDSFQERPLQTIILIDMVPAALAVISLAVGAREIPVTGALGMLVRFNFIFALVSIPAGWLSERVGRKPLIIFGWLVQRLIHQGFSMAQTGSQIAKLYVVYSIYHGLAYGSDQAMAANLVPEVLWGSACGRYNTVLGALDFPAPVIAGIRWQVLSSAGRDLARRRCSFSEDT